MAFRLRLGSARRFAALFLLLGVMLGGAVDAVACEPRTEIAVVVAADSADTGNHQPLPDNDRHGACIHGHCHHGAQQVPQIAVAEDLPVVADLPEPSGEHRLISITPSSLKRPPRA